jgi:membrane protease subunit HflK
MLTHDGDIVDVRFAVQYQVRKPTDYLFRSVDPDQSVMHAAQAAVRGIVGARSTNEILDQDRETMRQQLMAAIQQSLDQYESGLAVTGVTIQSVQVPDQVQAAFDDAQAYVADLLPRAQADVARQIEDAKNYSDKTVAQAQGEADRFKQVYAQYSKAPAVIRTRMYMETMQQIYSNTTKVFVDSKNGNNVLYLPLDKLVEQNRQRLADAAAATPGAAGAGAGAPQAASAAASSGASAAAAGTAAASAPAAAETPASQPASGASLRSRDAFRNRMREDDVQ